MVSNETNHDRDMRIGLRLHIRLSSSTWLTWEINLDSDRVPMEMLSRRLFTTRSTETFQILKTFTSLPYVKSSQRYVFWLNDSYLNC